MSKASSRHALPSAPTHKWQRVVAAYASSRFYRQGLDLLTALARPRLLDPELYGVWTLLKVIPEYATYHHLGSRTIARYRIPHHDARGERDAAETVASAAFSQSLATVLVLSGGLVACAAALDVSIEFRVGLLAMAVLIVLQAVYEFYVTLLRATQHFHLVTRLQYIRATAGLLLTVALVYSLGIYGLFLAVVGTMAILLVWVSRRFRYTPGWRWDARLMRDLTLRGAPVMAMGLGLALTSTVDRFLIAGMLGTESLGYYGIATLAFGFLSQAPGAAREVVEPKLMRRMADDPTAAAEQYFLRPTVNLAYGMPFLIGPVFFLLPVAVPVLLPRYESGVAAAQILSLGAHCYGLIYLLRMMVVAQGLQTLAALLMPLGALVSLGAGAAAIRLGYGVEGVAAGSVLALVFLLLLLLTLVAWRLNPGPPRFGRHVAGIVAAIALTDTVLPATFLLARRAPAPDWVSLPLGLACFTVVMLTVWTAASRVLPLLERTPRLPRRRMTDNDSQQ